MTTYATDIYSGDGSQVDFGVTFPFIQRSHVKVFRIENSDGSRTELTLTTSAPTGDEYQWQSDVLIRVGTAPTNVQKLSIERDTPEDQQLVQWADGSYIIAEDLNTSDKQWLYGLQELEDKFALLETTAIKYRGGVDLTVDTAPANPEGGDFFINTGAGTVIAGWAGIAGDTVSGGEQVIYNGSALEWQIFQTPASQQGVISVSGTAPITVDTTDPQRPIIGSDALTDITVTAPLTVNKSNPAEPALDITNATTSDDGTMSSADKTKLDGLPDNATLDATYLKKAGDTYTGYLDSSATSAFRFPQGTTGERPGTPNQGDVRFNTTTTEYEAYDGTNWGPLGGGLMHVSTTAPANFKEGNQWYDENTGRSYVYIDGTTQAWVDQNPGGGGGTTKGGGQDLVFQENEMVCTADYQLTANRSALSAGPITINDGVTITIPNNQNWVIL